MRDKHHITEERNEGKLSRSVLETSGSRERLAEFNNLACGVNSEGRVYNVGGFRGYRWFNRQLDKIRSKRDRCTKGSRRYRYLSDVYRRVSEKKNNKRKDCHHKASTLIAYKLAESAIVIGDLSQRQMVMKSNNRKRNRAVSGDWGLYSFVQVFESLKPLPLIQVKKDSADLTEIFLKLVREGSNAGTFPG